MNFFGIDFLHFANYSLKKKGDHYNGGCHGNESVTILFSGMYAIQIYMVARGFIAQKYSY